MPVAVPTVATEVLLLVHVPPNVVFSRLIVEPAHTLVGPVIVPAWGSGFIVT
jgi:hypothetical protein